VIDIKWAYCVNFQIFGLNTNVNFLMKLCRNRHFEDAAVHTGFIDEHGASLLEKEKVPTDVLFKIALAVLLKDAKQQAFAFRVNHSLSRKLRLIVGDQGNH